VAIALAALLALGALSAARPPVVHAETLTESPTLTVDPPCEPTPTNPDGDVITVTVRGYSFEYGRSVVVYWNGKPAPAPATAVGDTGSFEVSFTVTEIGSTSYYPIYAYYQDQIAQGSEVAWASVDVPCTPNAAITVTPDCGNAGTPLNVHVDGTGFVLNAPVAVEVTSFRGDNVSYATADPVTPVNGAISLDIPPFSLPANDVYVVQATQQVTVSLLYIPPIIAYAYIVAPCSSLTINPTCDTAGGGGQRISIQLIGTGMQPGMYMSVTFDAGDVPHQPQYFYSQTPVNQDGSWGPVDITPYARGPGTYDVVVGESNDSPSLHDTHATFTVDCPSGTVTLDPTCAPPQFAGDQPRSFELNVSGVGFQPGYPVTVTFDPDRLSGLEPETTQANALSDGSFVAPPLTVAARVSNTYRVSVQQQVGDNIVQGIVPPFNVPCVPGSPTPLRVDPTCGDAASDTVTNYSIRLRARGFIPGYVQITFDPDGTSEAFSAFADANGHLDTTIPPTARGPGTYRIVASQSDASGQLDSVSYDDFVVPCTTPTLVISPASVSVGFVVQVQGSGFPPGSTVDLQWSYGIGAGQPIEVTAGADGSFDRQVLIFQHDFTGPRQMTAGTPTNPAAYPGAQASLLVTVGQGSPEYEYLDGGETAPFVISR
jgi:hypothetical protein